MDTNDTDRPEIYVSILADYNNGEQRGEWIAATDADTIRDEIARILRTSKYPNVLAPCPDCPTDQDAEAPTGCETCHDTRLVPSAEEYAIHDYSGFYNIGRLLGAHPDLDTVAHAAIMIEEHGEAWALWAYNIGDASLSEDDFLEAYCGQYDDKEGFAAELVDELGILNGAGSTLAAYFDYSAFARDLFIGDYTFLDGHVFRNL